MLPKPDACQGCPLWQDGRGGFVPDEVIPGAEVYVLGQNPGDHEEKGEWLTHYEGKLQVYQEGLPAPLIGPTGHLMGRKYLPLAGLERGKHVSLGNVVRCRWKGTNSLPKLQGQEIQDAITHCQRAYYRPPASTRLVVALGEYAAWGVTGEPTWKEGHKVSSLRGWLHPYRPVGQSAGPLVQTRNIYQPQAGETAVLVAFHPAMLFRAPWEEPAAIQDWRKIGWVLKGEWPEPLPPIERQGPAFWPYVSGFDTEYVRETRKLVRWSLAWEEHPYSHHEFPRLRVCVVEAESGFRSQYVPLSPSNRTSSLAIGKVYSHNLVADLPYLKDLVWPVELEDTMFVHAVLYSDLDHTMDYLGSLYARINRWKHLEYTNPVEYSAGDAVGALDAGLALTAALGRDPESTRVYRQYMLPLLEPLSCYEQGRGIKLDPERVKASLQALNRVREEAQRRAQAAAGWPLALSSGQQVGVQLYGEEKVK